MPDIQLPVSPAWQGKHIAEGRGSLGRSGDDCTAILAVNNARRAGG